MIQGEINVEQAMHEARRAAWQRASRQAFVARTRRLAERDEERRVLRDYWRAEDKHAVVDAYPEVFARIAANRIRAQELMHQERELVDAWKQQRVRQLQQPS